MGQNLEKIRFLADDCRLSCLHHPSPCTDCSGGADSKDEAAIVVVGSGETRSVSTLVPSNLDVLPPGTSVQKALNFLPGVMSQSIDALGLNEQSMSLQVRGFPPPIWAMRSTAFRWATAPTTITTA
jgi:hypothetical protein